MAGNNGNPEARRAGVGLAIEAAEMTHAAYHLAMSEFEASGIGLLSIASQESRDAVRHGFDVVKLRARELVAQKLPKG